MAARLKDGSGSGLGWYGQDWMDRWVVLDKYSEIHACIGGFGSVGGWEVHGYG